MGANRIPLLVISILQINNIKINALERGAAGSQGLRSFSARCATRSEDRRFSVAMVPVALVLPPSCVPSAATAFVLGHGKVARSASAVHDVLSCRRGPRGASTCRFASGTAAACLARAARLPHPTTPSGQWLARPCCWHGRARTFCMDATANRRRILCDPFFTRRSSPLPPNALILHARLPDHRSYTHTLGSYQPTFSHKTCPRADPHRRPQTHYAAQGTYTYGCCVV